MHDHEDWQAAGNHTVPSRDADASRRDDGGNDTTPLSPGTPASSFSAEPPPLATAQAQEDAPQRYEKKPDLPIRADEKSTVRGRAVLCAGCRRRIRASRRPRGR